MGCDQSRSQDVIPPLGPPVPADTVLKPVWPLSKISSSPETKMHIQYHNREYIRRKVKIQIGPSDMLEMDCAWGQHMLYSSSNGQPIAFCKRKGSDFCIYSVGSPVYIGQQVSSSASSAAGLPNLYLYAKVKTFHHRAVMEARVYFIHKRVSSYRMVLWAPEQTMPSKTRKIVSMKDENIVFAEWSTKNGWHTIEKTTTEDAGLLSCLIVLYQFLANHTSPDHRDRIGLSL